jgi:phosphoribosylformylglycinamidine (FGAM) synthase-like amidotransferase family enzyme
MAKPKALIVRAPGTNCDIETAYAFELAGGESVRVHVNQLIENPGLADSFQILCFPGGFSYGDDIAVDMEHPRAFRDPMGSSQA